MAAHVMLLLRADRVALHPGDVEPKHELGPAMSMSSERGGLVNVSSLDQRLRFSPALTGLSACRQCDPELTPK